MWLACGAASSAETGCRARTSCVPFPSRKEYRERGQICRGCVGRASALLTVGGQSAVVFGVVSADAGLELCENARNWCPQCAFRGHSDALWTPFGRYLHMVCEVFSTTSEPFVAKELAYFSGKMGCSWARGVRRGRAPRRAAAAAMTEGDTTGFSHVPSDERRVTSARGSFAAPSARCHRCGNSRVRLACRSAPWSGIPAVCRSPMWRRLSGSCAA